jgi:hypothetical protein
MPCHARSAPVLRSDAAEPFASVEEAWFWTMQALQARRDGARLRAAAGQVARPCEPDDVVNCLDRLYRQRRIDLAHARVLRHWGDLGIVPSVTARPEHADRRLWDEAMRHLEAGLVAKGIVAWPGTHPQETAA